MSKDRDEIKITISGISASGKSTLAYIIQEHLLNTGFLNVTLESNIDYVDGSDLRHQMIDNINQRKDVMRKKQIIINEVQIKSN